MSVAIPLAPVATRRHAAAMRVSRLLYLLPRSGNHPVRWSEFSRHHAGVADTECSAPLRRSGVGRGYLFRFDRCVGLFETAHVPDVEQVEAAVGKPVSPRCWALRIFAATASRASSLLRAGLFRAFARFATRFTAAVFRLTPAPVRIEWPSIGSCFTLRAELSAASAR